MLLGSIRETYTDEASIGGTMVSTRILSVMHLVKEKVYSFNKENRDFWSYFEESDGDLLLGMRMKGTKFKASIILGEDVLFTGDPSQIIDHEILLLKKKLEYNSSK